MNPSEAPDFVRAWQIAHETEVFYGRSTPSSGYEPYRPQWEGWLDKAGDGPPFPIPPRDSGDYFKAMVLAVLKPPQGGIRLYHEMTGKLWVDINNRGWYDARDPVSALIAAVLAGGGK